MKILFLSNLGRVGQNALLSRTNDLRADIVVAGVPSEGEPLGDTLLRTIQPKVIIIADADHPATRKASSRLRARLETSGIPTVYTNDSRAVTIEIGNETWHLRAMDGTRIPDVSRKQPLDHALAGP